MLGPARCLQNKGVGFQVSEVGGQETEDRNEKGKVASFCLTSVFCHLYTDT